jgi:UDP-glucose 4-epimerase
VNLAGRKIVITGASGFIGSHVADRLAGDNELLLIDDFSIGPRENLSQLEGAPSVQIVEADITDREQMRQCLEGAEVVIHMAISCLRTSLNSPTLSHDINSGGTLSVLMAAHESGVERFSYVSSSEIYGTAQSAPMTESHPLAPTTVYGASKLAGELYALAYWRTYGLRVSVIRPFNTYGPREPYEGARAEVIPRFALQLDAGRSPVVYGNGTQTRDFTYVADTADGIVAATACDALIGEAVNIAHGREASINRIAELLGSLTERPDISITHTDPRPGDVDRHFANTEKAKRLFGFEALTDLETGLAKTVDWLREAGIADRVDADAAGAPNW